MTPTIQLPNASLESTTTFARDIFKTVAQGVSTNTASAQATAEVHFLSTVAKAKVPDSYSSIDEFVAELSCEEDFAQKLSNARQEISTRFIGLKARRLNLGLSQQDVATMIGTSQPHVARLEKNPGTMMFDTAMKLCGALQISLEELALIIQNQVETSA
ncbi:helix-turn-helix domain-containing protein [Aquipseudomonas alcaligenes]|uniref:helix-turn-helix domain-containing protein n=1 Tax=Aquipseudomonas alcaligenes TaxID=43263 RepID=UPI00365B90B0